MKKPAVRVKAPAIAIVPALGTSHLVNGAEPARSDEVDQPTPPPSSTSIACGPESPVVAQDGSVVLRAWTSASLPPETYKWVVTAGEIAGRGPELLWKFTGVASGMYRADLTVATESGIATCAIRLIVTEPDRGSIEHKSARMFLLPKQPEEAVQLCAVRLATRRHWTRALTRRH